MSKSAKLLAYLKRGGVVTGKIAMNRFGLYRLSEYIRRFRKVHNLPVITEMVTKKGVTFAKYYVNSKLKK